MDQPEIDLLKHLLAFKSISTQEEFLLDMEKARHFLSDIFTEMGFETKELKGKKHPALFAQKIVDKKLPTVLIYGHYDVQPPEPLEEWKTPPFEPTIKGDNIYARGSTDDKGQVMVHIMAAKKMVDELGDNLPVNFKFIIEGEEEIGSISVESLVKKYGKTLFKCDYILVSDSEMIGPGRPAIDIGLRGLVYAEVFVETGKHDLHSGQFGGVAENPAVVLVRILSQLKDKNNRITIPRFYNSVMPPTKKELREYKALGATAEQLKKEGQFFALGGGESKYSLNERRWSRPTLDINDLTSGYQGEGSKTIIPYQASAKVSIRIVPNQDPKKVYLAFEKYIKKLAPSNVKVRVLYHADALPYKAPTDHPIFETMKKSLKKAFGKEALFQGVGGSIGFIPVTANALKVPCLIIGFGLPDDDLHAPNEHFSLKNYQQGIKAMTDFYSQLGK